VTQEERVERMRSRYHAHLSLWNAGDLQSGELRNVATVASKKGRHVEIDVRACKAGNVVETNGTPKET
jgi:hypothetical protein